MLQRNKSSKTVISEKMKVSSGGRGSEIQRMRISGCGGGSHPVEGTTRGSTTGSRRQEWINSKVNLDAHRKLLQCK